MRSSHGADPMSANHATPEYKRFAATMRPILRAQIAAGGLPCVNRCRMGGWVMPGDRWDVGHIISLDQGGTNTYDNAGAAHTFCNRSDGGTAGARKTNQQRSAKRAEDQGTREW